MDGSRNILLDGAHNPHAGHAVARAIETLSGRDGRPVVMIVGMLGRKDARGFFDALKDQAPRVFTTAFESANATPPALLAQAARGAGLRADVVDGVTAGLEGAQRLRHGQIALIGVPRNAGALVAKVGDAESRLGGDFAFESEVPLL